MKNKAKTKISTLSERLKLAIEEKGLPVLTIAQLTGIKHQAIQYLCKSNAEKSKFTPLLAEVLDVNLSWLANGIGYMHPTKEVKKNKGVAQSIPLLNIGTIKQVHKKKLPLESITPEDYLSVFFSKEVNESLFAIKMPGTTLSSLLVGQITVFIKEPKQPKNEQLILFYDKISEKLLIQQYTKRCELKNYEVIGTIAEIRYNCEEKI